MEIVTLAHVTLHRVGSASRHALVRGDDISQVMEVSDDNPDTLMELIKNIAVQHGESREGLRALRREDGWHRNVSRGTMIFNVQGPNVQYSQAYAECRAHPAFKVGTRYFELNEIAMPPAPILGQS